MQDFVCARHLECLLTTQVSLEEPKFRCSYFSLIPLWSFARFVVMVLLNALCLLPGVVQRIGVRPVGGLVLRLTALPAIAGDALH